MLEISKTVKKTREGWIVQNSPMMIMIRATTMMIRAMMMMIRSMMILRDNLDLGNDNSDIKEGAYASC